MSDENTFDQTGSGYEPMPEAAPAEPRKKEYDVGNDMDTLREAASDLVKAREESRVPQAEPEISRDYRWTSGAKEGEKVPDNFTLDAERAARELTAVRQAEQAAKPENARFIDPQQQQPLQNAVDNLRRAFPDGQLPVDILEQVQAQQQAQPDQTQAVEPQSQVEQPVDPQQAERQQLEKAWAETPDTVKQALQIEIAQVTQARRISKQL